MKRAVVGLTGLVWSLTTLVTGCGGSSEPAAAPVEPAPEAPAEEPPPPPSDEKVAVEESEPSARAKLSGSEPEFKPGMTVEEAVAAVPKDTQRVNVDQEVLAEPLLKSELYAPCSPKGHFKLRVAVWDGRIVGTDVSTSPKNEKLETCLREQLEKVTYKDKAKSLNTVEFAM